MLPSRYWITALLCTARAVRPQAIFTPIQQPFTFARNLTTTTTMTRGAVIALSHGGGPLPLLNEPSHAAIIRSLKERVPQVLRLTSATQRPRAIVLVTAHWSTLNPCISSGPNPSLYYDYYGFPPETYELNYPAPGSPDVAREVHDLLQSEGMAPEMDDERGWDHGVFVPMMLIRPEADIPIVQVSVLESEDPAEHFKMGRALGKLRDSNVAIVGSGFASFHNLRLQFGGGTRDEGFRKRNREWNGAVADAVGEEDVAARDKKLRGWRKFPGGLEMHPRGAGEHLMPLLVCAGAGGEGKAESYTDEFIQLDMYTFYWH